MNSRSEIGGSILPSVKALKILQIGNYPPPACGWAVQTKLLKEEIRRRGYVCEVLNINESRKIKAANTWTYRTASITSINFAATR